MRRSFAPRCGVLAVFFALAAVGSSARAESVAATIAPQAAASVSVSGKLQVIINSVPLIGFNPANPTEPCSAPAGTVVSAVAVTGGDGNPVALAISDPAASFALSGTAPPANVIVGPNGIAAGVCPAAGAAPNTDIVTVTATQP